MYKVRIAFTDKEDGHIYTAGDVYPRAGVEPSDERIEYLLSSRNPFNEPVIEGKPIPKKKKREERE